MIINDNAGHATSVTYRPTKGGRSEGRYGLHLLIYKKCFIQQAFNSEPFGVTLTIRYSQVSSYICTCNSDDKCLMFMYVHVRMCQKKVLHYYLMCHLIRWLPGFQVLSWFSKDLMFNIIDFHYDF